LVRSG